MKQKALIEVDGLSKKFCRSLKKSLWYGVQDIFGELWPTKPGMRPGEFWALRDISFSLQPGESLGIVGRNGAGKSTLLKLLNGLLKPDAGQIRLRGRVGAIIELGSGFNPVLSGRENIFAQAAFQGISRRRAEAKLEPIVDFAGLGDFIDTPVQFYSSGMQARLAYAVAAHMEPDILLVDEALAVGDIDFQRKCLNHMTNYLNRGGTVILVSHASHQIQAVCQRGLVLEQGQETFAGPVTEALDYYFKEEHLDTPYHQAIHSQYRQNGTERGVLSEEHPVHINRVEFEPVHGEEIKTGYPVRVSVHYSALRSFEQTGWGFVIYTDDHQVCLASAHSHTLRPLSGGHGVLHCTIPQIPLAPGHYLVKVAISNFQDNFALATSGWEDTPHRLTIQNDATPLTNARQALGVLVYLDGNWDEVEDENANKDDNQVGDEVNNEVSSTDKNTTVEIGNR